MGWTTNDPGGDIEIGNGSVYGLPCDNAGCRNQEINANAFNTVSYTVTGLTVGKAYDLSWDYGGRTSGGPDFLNVSFGGNLLVQNFGSVGPWTDNAFSVVATASSETLTFASVDTSGSGGIPSYGNEITNVSLTGPRGPRPGRRWRSASSASASLPSAARVPRSRSRSERSRRPRKGRPSGGLFNSRFPSLDADAACPMARSAVEGYPCCSAANCRAILGAERLAAGGLK